MLDTIPDPVIMQPQMGSHSPMSDDLQQREASAKTALEKTLSRTRQLVIARPGVCTVVGLVAGGLAGWLTSKLR